MEEQTKSIQNRRTHKKRGKIKNLKSQIYNQQAKLTIKVEIVLKEQEAVKESFQIKQKEKEADKSNEEQKEELKKEEGVDGQVKSEQNIQEDEKMDGSGSEEEDSEDDDSEIEFETQEGSAFQAVVPQRKMFNWMQRSSLDITQEEEDLIGQLVCYNTSSKTKEQNQKLDGRIVGQQLGLGYMGMIVEQKWNLQDKWLFCQGLSEIGRRDFNSLHQHYLQHKDSSDLVSYYYNVWKIDKYNSEIKEISLGQGN
eukprot:TRINITY_DN1581_c0_g1_i10.p1 TRINITY_DN1581_c0_g1~~TRINITY_DN1581_c0_g1_i10.p1  ORF type:complete len:253 (-),score=51.90 TRINITY_DN1581_c0_g1_i10:269-1027(-)